MTPAFTHSRGVVWAREWPMTDADVVAVGEVFRAEIRSAFHAMDVTARKTSRALYDQLTQAQDDAHEFRKARKRQVRLDALLADQRSV